MIDRADCDCHDVIDYHLERIDSVDVVGANIMAGRYDDGSLEVVIAIADCVTPGAAKRDMELIA